MMLEKAEESLKAAQFCLDRGLYNSATSRAYYAMYQAVEVALNNAGFHRSEWSHPGLQATFSNELIKRRKLYSSVFSRYINRALELRIIADYRKISISQRQGAQAARWAEEIVQQVRKKVLHG
jgi:uncharacterized protein (UPF0332 family)